MASWVDGALQLWGWDGAHTALPNALHLAFARPAWPFSPLRHGHFSNLDVALPDGRTVRPASVRIPGEHAATWLTSVRPAGGRSATRSPGWPPSPPPPGPPSRPGWSRRASAPTGTCPSPAGCRSTIPVLAAALDELAASMPPICLPVPDDPTTVADIHAVMVDGLARNRLADAGLAPGPADGPGPGHRRPPGPCSGPSPHPIR